MADYSKQTVAQLRQLLKDRNIPSTGLTRKAQIIERLEQADNDEGSAENSSPVRDASDDAPPDPVDQTGEERSVHSQDPNPPSVPGQVLSEAGGESGLDTRYDHTKMATEPDAHLTGEAEPAPLPAAAVDPHQETISHIDSEIPAPDTLKAIERPAEDATVEEEAGHVQPAEVFSAPPADPEDVVGPRITEPTDSEVIDEGKEDLSPDALPHTPGPAAEALRFAQQKSGSSEGDKDAKMASPTPNEQSSAEKPELLAVPEGSTAETSRLNTEELESDSRKRKRRSGTPDVPLEDVRAKRHRPSQELAPEVHLKEDNDIVMEQAGPSEEVDVKPQRRLPTRDAEIKRDKKEQVTRYKELVDTMNEESKPPKEDVEDERPTVPALHPVTAALYVRNFMRPLRPETLRAHLVSLASPPAGSPDSSAVRSLFLDAMKTHALVLFSTTNAASRVRASLHGSVWPPEGNRKELWADFIPDDRVEEWIREEEDAAAAEKEARGTSRSAPPKRFEVIYPTSPDGSVTAVFQEVGTISNFTTAPAHAPRDPRGSIDARQPSVQTQPSGPTAVPIKDLQASFKTLDQLFSSTTAKPKLFYLPVSDEISDARLRELDAETSRDWVPTQVRKGRGIKPESKFKYTFDEENRIVEVGDDSGPWVDTYRSGRGRGGGFRGRGRGGGGGWRGGGGDGGWRGGR